MNRRDSFTVWTDSPNAFSDRDGRLPAPPVAPVQLQVQAYDALSGLALALTEGVIRDAELDATRLEGIVGWLRSRFLQTFVVSDDRGTFLACALERHGTTQMHPLASRTVNKGLALDSSLLNGDDARPIRDAVAAQLFTAEMRSPFGIVGRSRDDIRFEPFDYHSQVWAFASHKAANGLARHGYPRLASEIDARVMRQTADGLLPENVGATEAAVLQYCPHVLTVRRVAADGRMTETVKERPPAAYAAWTVAAIIEIDHRSGYEDRARSTASRGGVEDSILDDVPDQVHQSPADLRWPIVNSPSLQR